MGQQVNYYGTPVVNYILDLQPSTSCRTAKWGTGGGGSVLRVKSTRDIQTSLGMSGKKFKSEKKK